MPISQKIDHLDRSFMVPILRHFGQNQQVTNVDFRAQYEQSSSMLNVIYII